MKFRSQTSYTEHEKIDKLHKIVESNTNISTYERNHIFDCHGKNKLPVCFHLMIESLLLEMS